MKYKLLLIAAMFSGSFAFGQYSPEKLAEGFLFTEGPAPDKEGNVYFTDQPNNRIMKWSADGELTTFMQPSGRSNGLFIDNKGFIWACADEKNELWRISADKKTEVIAVTYEGQPFNGPNDVWVSPDGKIFFTDPLYKRSYWEDKNERHKIHGVYFLSPDNKTLKRVIEDHIQPNGIVGTPDGKILYIADIGDKKTWRYNINDDGTLRNKTLFCEMGSDGMTIDKKGNLYLTGDGVTIFNKKGKQIGHIPIPEKWTANVCFFEKDRKSLFITASKGIYKVRMKVQGVY